MEQWTFIWDHSKVVCLWFSKGYDVMSQMAWCPDHGQRAGHWVTTRFLKEPRVREVSVTQISVYGYFGMFWWRRRVNVFWESARDSNDFRALGVVNAWGVSSLRHDDLVAHFHKVRASRSHAKEMNSLYGNVWAVSVHMCLWEFNMNVLLREIGQLYKNWHWNLSTSCTSAIHNDP